MPRRSTVLAILVPLAAGIFILHSLDVSARLQLSWPLALHPDAQDDAAQIPVDFSASEPGAAPAKTRQGDGGGHLAPGAFRRKIVAVGDLHGDLPNAYEVLRMADVVTEEGDWSGNVDFFVQTGDIIDRGDDTIKLYDWMEDLREQALQHGGQVISHLGNHEWMNVIGDWRYVRPSEIQTFGTSDSRMKMLMTGRIAKQWRTNYTTTSRLPLHVSLGKPNTDYDPSSTSPLSHAAISFVHGGLAPNYPDLTPFPSKINNLGHSLLHKLQHRSPPPAPHPPNPYPGLPHDATPAEHRLYSTDGPLWFRGWALEPEHAVCGAVDGVLNKTGTRRMIMGHTPNFEKIISRCDGKIIIIDTGISHAYGGVLAALSIEYTLTPAPKSSLSGAKQWKEREVVTALYLDHQDILAITERDVEGDF